MSLTANWKKYCASGFAYLCIVVTALCLSGCSSVSKEQLYAKGMAEIKKSNPNGAIVYFKNALEKDPDFYAARLELAKALRAASWFDLSETEFAKLLAYAPADPVFNLEFARLHISSKKYGQAIRELEVYAQANGATPEYYRLSGIAYAAQKKSVEAIHFFQLALKADPSHDSSKLELAAMYILFNISDKRDEARRLINEVLQKQPANIRAHYLLIDMENAAGNQENVIKLYTKIAEIDVADTLAPYKLGLIYLAKGEQGKAEEVAANLLKRHPKRPEGMTLSGIIAFQKKQYMDAIPLLQKSLLLYPSGEAYYFLGSIHYTLGELETALTKFTQIADNTYFSQPSKCLMALIYLKQKRINDAISEIGKLLAVNPSHALAHNILGSAYIAKGMHDEGIREFKRAIELDPKIVDSHLKKGVVNQIQGRTREAESDFISAIRIAPELVNTRLILAGFYLHEKNFSKAMASLEQGITGKKGDAVMYTNMATLLFSQGKTAEALKHLQKAKQIDPDFLDASFSIAAYYAAANQPEQALQEYREIVKNYPDNAKALLGMAAHLEISGNDSEAKECYKRAIQTKEAPAYTAMASYFLRKKKVGKAISVLNEGIKAIAGNFDAMQMKEQILVSQEKYTDALKMCEDMISINPHQGLQYKVGVLLKMNDPQRAIDLARQYITINLNTAFGHMILADIYDSRNDQASAIKELREGVRKEANNFSAMVKLGNHLGKSGDFKAAMETYRAVLRQNAEFMPAIFAQGITLEKIGNKKEAMEKYKEALIKSGSYVPALNNLAYLYVSDSSNLQEGLRMAYLAFRLEPSNPSVLDTLGFALLKSKGGAAASLQVLEKAISLAPSNASIQYHLALAYQENGLRSKAVTSLRQSLTQGDFPDAGNARSLLEKLK